MDDTKTNELASTIERKLHVDRKGKLGGMGRRKRVAPIVDPIAELRDLVQQHAALQKASVATSHMSSDRTARDTGEKIPCRLPLDARVQLQGVSKALSKSASGLELGMLRALREVPIWRVFLQNVYGLGPVCGAYLAVHVDIRRSEKPSQLKRYLGVAPAGRLAVGDAARSTGRLERATRGVRLGYNATMRTKLWNCSQAMLKNAARPPRSTTKYLEIWAAHKLRLLHSDRVVGGRMAASPIFSESPQMVSALGHAHSAGRWKAMSVLADDLYTVWRALEGLPVWPDWYAAKLGYAHGGDRIDVKAQGPRMLTLDEALALVGHVGRIDSPLHECLAKTKSVGDSDVADDDDEEEDF